MNILTATFIAITLILTAVALWTVATRNWVAAVRSQVHRVKHITIAAVETVLASALSAVLGFFWYIFTA
jgi:NADH:ubiquinone oxidoreductase subunit K